MACPVLWNSPYHFTRPSTSNIPGYSASLSRVNNCWAVNIVRPLSQPRQQVLMLYWLRRWFVSHSRSRCPRPHKVRAQVTDSHNLSLFFLRPPPSLSLSLCAQVQGYLFSFEDFVIVLILPHLPRRVQDRDSTESLSFYLFVISAGPPRALPLLAWSGDLMDLVDFVI